MKIYEAVDKFVGALNLKAIDRIDRIAGEHGSYLRYLDRIALDGNYGERYVLIDKGDAVSGKDQLIEWQDSKTYRIYYEDALSFKIIAVDLYDLDVAINEALKLLADPDAENVVLNEYVDGQPHRVIKLEEYLGENAE